MWCVLCCGLVFYIFRCIFSRDILELVGGLYSGSLAILTDAAHLLTDMSSFIISLVAIHLSERPGTVHDFTCQRYNLSKSVQCRWFQVLCKIKWSIHFLFERFLHVKSTFSNRTAKRQAIDEISKFQNKNFTINGIPLYLVHDVCKSDNRWRIRLWKWTCFHSWTCMNN